MGDSYEAWQECKRRLADEPDSTFLQRVESSLRQNALEDYLESFRGLDGNEETLTVDEHEAAVFLRGLDELRAPSDAELRRARVLALRDAEDRIKGLLKLNWTGDHLYSDAVHDALVMLTSVSEGKPTPKLERFRCESLYQPKRTKSQKFDLIRCEKQLPHGDQHVAYAAAGMGSTAWTDEQALNPPKNYGEEVSESATYCGAKHDYSDASKSVTLYCRRAREHEGDHQAPSGELWPAVPPQAARCDEWLNAGAYRGQCEDVLGHEGLHQAVGYGRWRS